LVLDQFFKELREIQKKERANSSLARVGIDFYKRIYKYLDKLRANIGNDPFSNEHYLLKDIQRIATEICERREHKITDAAVMNIQRSYHLFKGKPKFDLLDTTPLNLTNEEEKLYFSLIDTLKNHRQSISLDKLTEGLEDDSAESKIKSKSKNASKNNSQDLEIFKEATHNDTEENNYLNKNEEQTNIEKVIKTTDESDDSYSNDKVLNRLNEIKKAKIIKDENYENVNDQINKSLKKTKGTEFKSTDFKENTVYNIKSSKSDFNKIDSEKSTNIDDIELDNILKDENNQFVELSEENFSDDLDSDESIKLSKYGKIDNETILIFSEFGAIVGVDEKIYGPFYPQDIVVMPNVNANIVVKNKKGRLVKI
jgi:DNA replication factor GINS